MNSTISKNRTKNYFKQLKGSFVFKVLTIMVSFLLIPIMIKYLGKEQYGIWSTLLSIVSWILLFDIGIGNGLRNKITESIAKENINDTQKYISTAYVIIGIISAVLLSLTLFMSNFISWQAVFNTTTLSENTLNNVVQVMLIFLFTNFFLSLINQVFNGLQKTSLVVFNQLISNSLSLLLTYLLSLYTDSSLLKLALAYGSALVLSNLVFSIWFYIKNKTLRPTMKQCSLKHMKSISSLGLQFFVIQIAVIVLFTTDKLLITQLFGPQYVTEYDILFKLFSIITIVHGLLMAPLWNAYSDAYHRQDFSWIKSVLKKQLLIWLILFASVIILIFLAPHIIYLWIGNNFHVDLKLTIAIAFFILITTWSNIFSYLLNAINILNIQIITSVIAMFINIPLSIILVKYFELGTYGVVLGTIISLSIFGIFGPIHTYKILKYYGN